MAPKIIIGPDLYLSPPGESDKPFFVKYLNEKAVADLLLRVPSPYKESDADVFLALCEKRRKETGKIMNWSIRQGNGELIGGVGLHMKYGAISHKDEVGYWLAKPFWNQGIMTKALKALCEHAFGELGLVRIEACIFEGNDTSMHLAEKCGFVYEGTLKKAYFKDGKYFNAKLYALVKE